MPRYEQGRTINRPCADPTCRTQGGYMERERVTPRRTRGLCNTCYARHFHAGTLEQFPLKAQAEIVRRPPTRHPAPHSRYAAQVRNRRERKAERLALIAERVATHEAQEWHGHSNPQAPWRATETAFAAIKRTAQADDFAREWLAKHPAYHERWVREEPAA